MLPSKMVMASQDHGLQTAAMPPQARESLTIWSRRKKGVGERNTTCSCPSFVISAIIKCCSFGRDGSNNVLKSYPRNICTGHTVLPLPTIPSLPPHTPSELSLTNNWSYLYLHLMKHTYELKDVTRWYLFEVWAVTANLMPCLLLQIRTVGKCKIQEAT